MELSSNEIIGLGTGVVGVMSGGIWGAIKLIVSPHVKKVEEHDKDIADLKENGVKKADLTRAETTIIGAVREMKDDMVTRIGAVQRTADAAHERLDRQNEAELQRLRAEHRAGG